MAQRFQPSAWIMLCICASFALHSHAASSPRLEIGNQEKENAFAKVLASGECGGAKVDLKKLAKSVKKITDACLSTKKGKSKAEDPMPCFLVESGHIEKTDKAYDDETQLIKNLDKLGWYEKKAVRKIASEVYSKGCPKKFTRKPEEGAACIAAVVQKVCGV